MIPMGIKYIFSLKVKNCEIKKSCKQKYNQKILDIKYRKPSIE